MDHPFSFNRNSTDEYGAVSVPFGHRCEGRHGSLPQSHLPPSRTPQDIRSFNKQILAILPQRSPLQMHSNNYGHIRDKLSAHVTALESLKQVSFTSVGVPSQAGVVVTKLLQECSIQCAQQTLRSASVTFLAAITHDRTSIPATIRPLPQHTRTPSPTQQRHFASTQMNSQICQTDGKSQCNNVEPFNAEV